MSFLKKGSEVMEDGVWRTVGGRRIFIKEGQSLTDAMKDSKKFNKDNSQLKNKISLVNYIKEQTEIDLEKAITEKQFAPRRGLNIDSRKLNTNEFNTVKSILLKKSMRIESNGVYDYFITYQK
jgi:hypothetical protein